MNSTLGFAFLHATERVLSQVVKPYALGAVSRLTPQMARGIKGAPFFCECSFMANGYAFDRSFSEGRAG